MLRVVSVIIIQAFAVWVQWVWVGFISVFINPCIGDYANDSNGDPRICNPLLSNSCDDEFFCLAGDTTIKESSICCPKLTGKIFNFVTYLSCWFINYLESVKFEPHIPSALFPPFPPLPSFTLNKAEVSRRFRNLQCDSHNRRSSWIQHPPP